MEAIRRKDYYLSIAGLVIFAALSAGRDVFAKELFKQSKMRPAFATFFICIVSWIIFYVTASVARKGPYLFDDFRRASREIKVLVYWSNVLTLIGFLTALMAIDATNAYVSALIDYGGSPIITALLAMAILRETSSRGALIGLSVSLVGVIMLVGGLVGGTEVKISARESVIGTLCAIVSAVAFGLNQVVNKRLVVYGLVREKLWLLRLPLAVVVLGVFAVTKGMPDLDSWAVLVVWAAVGTTAPLFLLVFAFEHLRVSNIASFLFLVPLFTFIGSWSFRHFSDAGIALYLISGFLVMIGVFVTERFSYEADDDGT